MKVVWVKPVGLQTPRPFTKCRVELELPMEGRRTHRVGEATVYPGGSALLRITEVSSAGQTAIEWLREGYLTAVYWGSKPTLRLR